jgi:dipeptidyl aminopeptidase/acylaminoacyl peptidase
MSIFYNNPNRASITVRSMRLLYVWPFLLLNAVSFAGAQEPASPVRSPALRPLAFLTKHEWEAELPDSPDGKKIKIHAQFTWSQNVQAIRIRSQFVINGKTRPYLDGLYAWDPRQRAIVFWYVDAQGSLTSGRVKTEDGKLVHEFDQVTPDGKSSAFVAKVTPHGEQAWENEIFEQHGSELKPMVKVRYETANQTP